MKTTILGTPEGLIEDGKRLSLPGVCVKSDCPKCGHTQVFDLSDYYLSYPPMNCDFDFGCWHDECDGAENVSRMSEWTVKLRLNVSLTVGRNS